jgi:hypothetical protein
MSKAQGILAALVLGGSIAALAVPDRLSAAALHTIAGGLLVGILALPHRPRRPGRLWVPPGWRRWPP